MSSGLRVTVLPISWTRRPWTRGLATACAAAIISTLGCQAKDQTAPSKAQALQPGATVTIVCDDEPTELRYSVQLEPDQYLQVVAEQQGVDIAITLLDPDGTQLLVVDGPTGARGQERLDLVTNKAGTYQLLIGHGPGTGSSTLRIEQLHAATEKDRLIAGALADYCRADALVAGNGADNLVQALALYEQAAAVWQAEQVPGMQVNALTWIADIHIRQARPVLAREALEQALPLVRARGEPWREADLLNQLGLSLRRLGRIEAALTTYQQARQIAAQAHYGPAQGAALTNMGQIYQLKGEMFRVLEVYDQAMEIWKRSGDHRRAAHTTWASAEALIWMERLGEAEEKLQRSLAIAHEHDDQRCVATVQSYLGWLRYRCGDPVAAIEQYEHALTYLTTAGERYREAVTRDFYGRALLALGRVEQAQQVYDQALTIFRTEGNTIEAAVTTFNMADLLRRQQRYHEAAALGAQSLAQLRLNGSAHGRAEALLLLARCELALGQLEQARAHIEEGISIFETIREEIRLPDLRTSFSAARHELYELHTEILMQLHERDPEGGYDSAALENAERGRARTLLESMAARLDSQAARHANGADDRHLREQQAELQAVLATREDQHLQLLLQGAPQSKVSGVEAEIGYLLRELEKRSLESASATGSLQPLTLDQIRQQLDEDESQLLLYALGEPRSFVWLVGKGALSCHVLPGRSAVEQEARRAHHLLRCSHLRRGRVQSRLQAAVLGDMLLGPVAAELTAKRLVVIGDGVLQLVPFAALPQPLPAGAQPPGRAQEVRYLLRDHEVVQLPSISVMAAIRRSHRHRSAAAVRAAVFTDPVFSTDDQRLTGHRATVRGSQPAATRSDGAGCHDAGYQRLSFSGQEAAVISKLLPVGSVRVLAGVAATKEAALDPGLEGYQLLHFATHGLLHSQHPELSALVLSLVDQNGEPHNGFLRAFEIAGLHLPAELVVLSACRTGDGEELRGEGIVNLTRAFLCAGAARLVVSLWNVNDQAAVELMLRFYRGMQVQHLAPAAALRAAQLSMLDETRWQAPYYWAGFVFQGDWRAFDLAGRSGADQQPSQRRADCSQPLAETPTRVARHETSGTWPATRPEQQQREDQMEDQTSTGTNRINGEAVSGRSGVQGDPGAATLFPPTQLPGDLIPKVGDRDLRLDEAEIDEPEEPETERTPPTQDPGDPGPKAADRVLELDDDEVDEGNPA